MAAAVRRHVKVTLNYQRELMVQIVGALSPVHFNICCSGVVSATLLIWLCSFGFYYPSFVGCCCCSLCFYGLRCSSFVVLAFVGYYCRLCCYDFLLPKFCCFGFVALTENNLFVIRSPKDDTTRERGL